VKTNAVGDTLWSRTYGGAGYENCYSSQQTTDGGYVLAGFTGTFAAGSRDFWLVKTNANGDSLWSRTYGGSESDECYSVQQTDDGGYVLAGYTDSFDFGSSDFWLVKTNAVGDSLWSRKYGGNHADECHSVQQTTDGGYVLAGYTASFGAGSFDFWLVKTNADGDMLWTRTFGGSNLDDCKSIQQTSDGGYVLAGYTGSYGAGNVDFWLVKTDANGDSLWSHTYGDFETEVCYSVVETADSGFVLVGNTNSIGAGDDDIWAVKTTSTGIPVWSRTYGGIEKDRAAAVSNTDDGGVVIAGYSQSFGDGSSDFFAIKVGPVEICYGSSPSAPNDVIITFEGNDAHLSWSPVFTDSAGCLLGVTHYIVFFSELAEGPFWYLGHTEFLSSSFVHDDVVHYADAMYYEVVSTTDPLPAELTIPVGTPKQEVLELLNQ